MNELASSFLSGSLTLTDDHGFVLDEFQFAEAGRVNEKNVLLHVDPVGLVDVAKHVHSGRKEKDSVADPPNPGPDCFPS